MITTLGITTPKMTANRCDSVNPPDVASDNDPPRLFLLFY